MVDLQTPIKHIRRFNRYILKRTNGYETFYHRSDSSNV